MIIIYPPGHVDGYVANGRLGQQNIPRCHIMMNDNNDDGITTSLIIDLIMFAVVSNIQL